jgi:hypothetical protein
MKAKILGIAGALAGALATGASAFAVETPIAMDTTVQDKILNLITSYVTVAFSLLGVVIGAVGVLWISMKGIGLIFKYFHMFGHGR